MTQPVAVSAALCAPPVRFVFSWACGNRFCRVQLAAGGQEARSVTVGATRNELDGFKCASALELVRRVPGPGYWCGI
jgi:hypothetical protein